MRQRITFIHEPGHGTPPDLLKITDTTFIGTGIDLEAIREDRLTIPMDELPREISQLFRASCQELHVRWVSPSPFTSVSPLSSRASPGLHIFLTPAKEVTESTVEALVAALTAVFGLKGLTEKEALENHFTKLETEHSESPGSLQYYEPQESPSALIALLKRAICHGEDECSMRAQSLQYATSIDLSLDAATKTAKFSAQWPFQAHHHLQEAAAPGHRTEVGILGLDSAVHTEEHDLGVSGLLTVIGEHKTPSPVMFALQARHREAEASFTSAFVSPAGLHPTLQLKISSTRPPVDDGSCAIHAHFTLPKTIFADRYQLSDELFLASKNLTALKYSSSPVDLEAPVYAVPTWGSNVLLELAPPAAEEGPWTAEVPLHLRYLKPNSDAYDNVELPYPVVFWACAADSVNTFSNNPFDRTSLGYDALFSPKTAFWHVEPKAVEADRLMSPVRVPVLDTDDAQWVRSGTSAAIGLGFAIVMTALVGAYFKFGYGRQSLAKAKAKKDGDKKKQ